MGFVTEDGTGKLDANSYVAVYDFKNYCDDRGIAYADYHDTDIEQAAIRATMYLDGRYKGRWRGARTHGREQALDWPRDDVIDAYGQEIDAHTIPLELLQATYEAMSRELASPNSLTPDYVPSEAVAAESVGPISMSYRAGDANPRPRVTLIDEILAPLLTSSGGMASGSLLRF